MLRSQNLIPLIGGAYKSRSYISDNEISENLFVEATPQENSPPMPTVTLPREGKRALSVCPIPGPGRGVFTASTGALYAAVGQFVYSIDPNWQWTQLGQISNLNTPVSMVDNGTTLLIVDGTKNGYTVIFNQNGQKNVFAALNDSTGTFQGSVRTDFSDTFMMVSPPGTNSWAVSLSNQVAFNALVQANKDTSPDPIQTLAFNLRQAVLLGTQGTEIWYLAGSTPFPYQEWPNIYIPYGCAAKYSLVQADVNLFWISENPQGQKIALMLEGYDAKKISTEALEYEWTNYPTVTDCVASTFQQAGHTFIIFHFPTADKTWAYDKLTKQWHRRTWIDNNGIAHRERTSFNCSVGGAGGYPATVIGQDWSTGQIYSHDPLYYTDNGQPIVCRRTFPHQMKDMHFITHTSFVADFETGDNPNTAEIGQAGSPWSKAWSNAFGPLVQQAWQQPQGPALCMRYSNDGGNTWSPYRQKTLLSAGHYRSMQRWRGLGMGRDRVFELLWAYPGKSALQGAYLEVIEHSS